MGTILKNGINYSGTSGGSGVSSYTELTEKPKIEGVVLSGNKTASDLGLAKASDVPSTDTCYATSDTAETTIADGDYFPFQDVSANGKRKTLWSNIKSVLKTYFDTLYQKTLTAGTNITISSNTISAMATIDGFFDKADLYSTTEKVVGCWIDGRPLYQRTYTFTTPTVTTAGTEAAITITSLGSTIAVKDISAWFTKESTAQCRSAIQVDSSGNEIEVYISTAGDFNCRNKSSTYSNRPAWVTIKYTKTTDSANSYNYASVNDYSTSEKIVGTWINGENLYQRTFTGTTSSSGVLTQVASFSSSWYIRSFEGSLVQGSGIYVPISYTNGVDPNNLTTLGKDSVFPYTENGKLYMLVGEYNQGKSYCLTIKYTK